MKRVLRVGWDVKARKVRKGRKVRDKKAIDVNLGVLE